VHIRAGVPFSNLHKRIDPFHHSVAQVHLTAHAGVGVGVSRVKTF
jgi:hypothetical protein